MFNKLAGLSTRTKLTAILVSLLVPVAMLFYFDISSSVSTIRFARSEDIGNDWARPLVDTIRNLAEHRDHAARVAGGHEDERAEMQEHQGRVEESVKILDGLDRENAGGFSRIVSWNTLRAEVVKVVTADPKVAGDTEAHTALIAKLLETLHQVTSQSGLALDPDADSYALVSANILQLPTGLDALALARRHFDSVVAGDNSAAMRMNLGEQLGIASARMDFVFKDLTQTYASAAPQDKATSRPARPRTRPSRRCCRSCAPWAAVLRCPPPRTSKSPSRPRS